MRKPQYSVGLVGLAILTIGCLTVAAQRSRTQQPSYVPLSGTYELENTRGGDPRRAAETATRSMPPGQRDRAYQSLLSRLEPPRELSIDRVGRTITIASSRGARSEFDADGRSRSERGPNGPTTTRAEIVGDKLTVSTSGGSRGSDFSVTFEALDRGANMLVTRRLDDEDLSRPVTIQSYYRRTAATPRWDVYADDRGYNNPRSGGWSWFEAGRGTMMIPDGTRLRATLDTPFNMRRSRNGEPFTMTVRSPADFDGARIEGVLSRVSGYRDNGNNGYRDNGNNMDVRVDFQTIHMRGRSSDFTALLNTIRLPNGDVLRVNEDGEVRDVRDGRDGRDGNRGDTIQNGAIGATVGAIIGALAGGGKGAAVGAIIGGAGGVILSQGHEQLDLPPGTDVTLTVVSRYRMP